VGRVLAPLFLLLLILVARRELREHKRWAVAAALVLAILVAPTLWFVVHQPDEALARFRRISIAQPGMLPAQVVGQFLVNYAKHFDPIYLAVRGDREPRHSIGTMGEIYPLELPFLLLGIYFLARRRNAGTAVVLGWIALAPVASSMTNVGIPHALRSLAGAPAFALAIAVGVVEFIRTLPDKATRASIVVLLCCGELLLVGYASWYYAKMYPSESGEAWQTGFNHALDFCLTQQSFQRRIAAGEPEVWISESVGGLALPPEIISPVEILFAFYCNVPPEEFQKGRLRERPVHVVHWGTSFNDLLTRPNRPPICAMVSVGEIAKEITQHAGVQRYLLLKWEKWERWPICAYWFPAPGLDQTVPRWFRPKSPAQPQQRR
jgi:hypothetical protein